MNWWKRLSNRFRKYEKWIEIKIPDYMKNKEDDFFKDDKEILDDEENVLQKIGREEE